MRLISLEIKNFMPYKGSLKLEFPNDPKLNVMIVFGNNERGKTSLLNAIRWAIYGNAKGRHLKEIPLHELLNKEASFENDWTLEANIKFEADGHNYDLRRTATKRELINIPKCPEDFDVKIGLTKDNDPIPEGFIEAEINRLIPEQVSRFFLFDGELLQEYETLLIEGDEQGERIKESIEQVLGVPTLINGRDVIGSLLKDSKRLQSKDLATIKGLENQAKQQEDYQIKQEIYEADLKNLLKKRNEIKTSRIQLEDDLEKVNAIYKSSIKLDDYRQRQKDRANQKNNIKEERLQLLKDAWLDLIQPRLLTKKDLLLKELTQLNEQEINRSKIISRIDDLHCLITSKECPICGQSLDEKNKNKKEIELNELNSKLKSTLVNQGYLNTINENIQEVKSLIKQSVSSKIFDLNKNLNRLEVELTSIENKIIEYENEIKGYDTVEISQKRKRCDGLLKEEGKIEKDIEIQQGKILEIKNQLKILAQVILGRHAAHSFESSQKVEIYSKLEQIFEQSIEHLRDNLRSKIEAYASEAFKQLTNQKTYKGLEINKNYGLNIIDDRGSHVTIRSAGAEQIVALSLINGLARIGRLAGPVVMDTPFGQLDLKHRGNILRYLPTTTGQLVLLVHDGEIRRDTDLDPIADRIGSAYEIKEINSRHSIIERKHTWKSK